MRIYRLRVDGDGTHHYKCGRCSEVFSTKLSFVERCPNCNFLFKDPRPRYKKYITFEIDGKTIPRHRLVLEALGIDLTGLSVHHIDENCKNDNLDNLYICKREEHDKIHRGEVANPKKGNAYEILEAQRQNSS